MVWRDHWSLTPEEAWQLHYDALIIGTLAYGNGLQILSTPTIETRLHEVINQRADQSTIISQVI